MKQKTEGRLYSIPEAYWIYLQGIRSMRFMAREKKKGQLNSQFIERIMLAVTEVNKCSICSYAHTKMALEKGMKAEEIRELLQGDHGTVPDDELEAILFAQHYADSRGKPSKASWEHIVKQYGKDKAYGILGSIRIIMIGNVYGIPFGSFTNRFKVKADKRSSIFYELAMICTIILYTPVVILNALLFALLQIPII